MPLHKERYPGQEDNWLPRAEYDRRSGSALCLKCATRGHNSYNCDQQFLPDTRGAMSSRNWYHEDWVKVPKRTPAQRDPAAEAQLEDQKRNYVPPYSQPGKGVHFYSALPSSPPSMYGEWPRSTPVAPPAPVPSPAPLLPQSAAAPAPHKRKASGVLETPKGPQRRRSGDNGIISSLSATSKMGPPQK